jgi:hypothetical protein
MPIARRAPSPQHSGRRRAAKPRRRRLRQAGARPRASARRRGDQVVVAARSDERWLCVRLARLRALVAAGAYRPQARAVAARLVADLIADALAERRRPVRHAEVG